MARWKKTLKKLRNDTKMVGYHYDDLCRVLDNLGFVLAPANDGSHRKWRCKLDDDRIVVVGLVEGHDPLKPYLVRDMLKTLIEYDLLPKD